MFKYPQSHKIHKKVAQLQLDLKPAKEYEDPQTAKIRAEAGCVFISLAKAKEDGSGTMDWANKINMKLEANDIAKIITGVKSGKTVDIFHKSSETRSTSLKIESGNPGTFKLAMGTKDESRTAMASIFLNTEDLFVMFNLLEASIPLTLGWA